MSKLVLLIPLLTLFSNLIIAQKVCEADKEKVIDPNSISHISKCSVNHTKNNKTGKSKIANVQVISARNRQKRRIPKERVYLANELTSAKINAFKTKDSIEKLTLKSIRDNITAIHTALDDKNNSRTKISFDAVHEIPKFDNCKDAKDDEGYCFNMELQNHLINNLIYPEVALEESLEAEIWVRFEISTSGKIKNIITTGPENCSVLKKEAIRVISKLPTLTPGKQNNQPVAVIYEFPINFSLNTQKE